MLKLDSYLNFDGTCEEAFNFYRSVFGGEFNGIMRMKDVDEMDLPEAYKERIMHISLPVGNDTLMGSDTIPGMGNPFQPGNSNYICLSTDSRGEADRLFNGLSVGGEIEMPMEDMFWGDYFGSFKDRFGIMWMISFSSGQPMM